MSNYLVLKGKERDLIRDRKAGDLVYLGLETSNACNLQCKYCYTNGGERRQDEISVNDRKSVIQQAVVLGARVMYIAGSGEPLCDPGFKEQIECAYVNGLTTILYTNGTLIDKEKAAFLFSHDVSPVIKLESLNPETHDYLTGVKGSLALAIKGIDELLIAGFGKNNDNITRIGVASLYLKQNIDDLIALKSWCDDRKVLFMVDTITSSGRAAMKNENFQPQLQKILSMKKLLGEESGCLEGEGCVYWKYGMNIKVDGRADFCAEGNTKNIGNIKLKCLVHLLKIKNSLYKFKYGENTCFVKENLLAVTSE